MSLRLSDYEVLHSIASSFSISLGFSRFFACILYFKFLEIRELNKTIIPFAFVGYETGYSQLGATPLVKLAIYHLTSNARSWNNC